MSTGYTQLATYWGSPTIDGYGKRTFASPTTLYTKWEDRTDLTIHYKGEMSPSKARVYVLEDLALGGYLALGNQTSVSNPETLDTAYLIKSFQKVASIGGTEYTRKVLL